MHRLMIQLAKCIQLIHGLLAKNRKEIEKLLPFRLNLFVIYADALNIFSYDMLILVIWSPFLHAGMLPCLCSWLWLQGEFESKEFNLLVFLSQIYAKVELPLDMLHRVFIEIFPNVGSTKPIATSNRNLCMLQRPLSNSNI